MNEERTWKWLRFLADETRVRCTEFMPVTLTFWNNMQCIWCTNLTNINHVTRYKYIWYVPLVVITPRSFPRSWFITGFVTRLTRRQWPEEKVQKDKQRSTKQRYKTKYRVTRTPLKIGGECICFWNCYSAGMKVVAKTTGERLKITIIKSMLVILYYWTTTMSMYKSLKSFQWYNHWRSVSVVQYRKVGLL
jgi:hypothetical protein